MTRVICVEGPDQVGKATQSKMLVDHINRAGLGIATRVEIPYDDKITHRVLYWMLRNGLAKRFPNAFQWLQFVNRRLFQCTRLLRLFQRYDYIVFDRWSLSSVVYGEESGANKKLVDFCYEHLFKPHATVVITVPSHSKRQDDDYEKDDSLQARVRTKYRDWAKTHKGCVLVEQIMPIKDTHDYIVHNLRTKGLI